MKNTDTMETARNTRYESPEAEVFVVKMERTILSTPANAPRGVRESYDELVEI